MCVLMSATREPRPETRKPRPETLRALKYKYSAAMPSICSVVLAVCCVVSLSCVAGEQHATPILQNSRSRRQVIDGNNWNGSLRIPEGFAEVHNILLSTAEPWAEDFIVNNATKEMDIYFGKQLNDTLPPRELFEKYFSKVTPQSLNITSEVAVQEPRIISGNVAVLNVAPVQAGTFSLDYSGSARGVKQSGRWTVHYVPTVTLRRGSFFRVPLHIVGVSVVDSLHTRDLNDIAIDVDTQRELLSLYGFASEELHDKVLNIKLTSADSASHTIKIRILTEERQPAQGESHLIHVTLAANLTTIRSRIKLADCVASACDRDSSHLTGVVFRSMSTHKTIFEAQMADVEDPRCFANITRRIQDCSAVSLVENSIDTTWMAQAKTTMAQAKSTTAQAKSTTSDDDDDDDDGAAVNVTELSTTEVALEETRTTNKTDSKQFGSYATVRVHVQTFASAWLVILVVLFLLIMILSR